jgi:hypothetical protein
MLPRQIVLVRTRQERQERRGKASERIRKRPVAGGLALAPAGIARPRAGLVLRKFRALLDSDLAAAARAARGDDERMLAVGRRVDDDLYFRPFLAAGELQSGLVI